MLKYENVKIEIEEKRIKECSCDLCGKDLEVLDYQAYGGVIAKVEFDYGSGFDGEVYKIVICDECFKEKFERTAHQID